MLLYSTERGRGSLGCSLNHPKIYYTRKDIMEKEQNTVELTRSMYKEIKSMNRDQMQQVLTNIYDQGAKSVEHGAIEFEKLREEIGKINGIGEKRLDEIMAVIESFISPAE